MTREQAEHDYDVQLERLVNSLRALADRVEQTGNARPRPDGLSSQREQPDRTFLASDVHDLVLAWVGERNSHLTSLMFAAIAAEHPAASSNAAQLLDRSATALAEHLGSSLSPDVDPEVLADLALRGAGIIR